MWFNLVYLLTCTAVGVGMDRLIDVGWRGNQSCHGVIAALLYKLGKSLFSRVSKNSVFKAS